jgi:hypothetical protein
MIIPTEEDARTAVDSSRQLVALRDDGQQILSIRVESEGRVESIPLPYRYFALLTDIILTSTWRAADVTVVLLHAELTTQEAAGHPERLRPFVIQLAETGKLPHRKVGYRTGRIRLRGPAGVQANSLAMPIAFSPPAELDEGGPELGMWVLE